MTDKKEVEENVKDEADNGKAKIKPDTSKMVKSKDAAGKSYINNGDDVATGLKGANIDEIKGIAKAMGMEDVNKYDHLNVGQQRMNLGNRIRGMVTKLDRVHVKLVSAVASKDATDEDKKAAAEAQTGIEIFNENLAPVKKAIAKRELEAVKDKKAKEVAREKKAEDSAKAKTDAAAKKDTKAAA